MSGAKADAVRAQKVFEVENDIKANGEADDARYFYDEEQQEALRLAKPWAQDPNWFKNVHISAVALIKMAMHARSGGNIEVMGSMQGKIEHRAFVVLDVFPLPVEGTETRVNAGQEGNEFLVNYTMPCSKLGRRENVVGWYHSHPGYGCWLSGIDVQTQSTHQQFGEPFLAIVVDPIRTVSAGKVDLGAFRTYPADYKKPDSGPSEYQTIPLNKIEDFGVHSDKYYQLDVSYFKSTLDSKLLDLLWTKYWARSLSTSPLIQSQEYVVQQIGDLGSKISKASQQLVKPPAHRRNYVMQDRKNPEGKAAGELEQISRDAQKCCGEHSQSMMSMWMKHALFNTRKKGAANNV